MKKLIIIASLFIVSLAGSEPLSLEQMATLRQAGLLTMKDFGKRAATWGLEKNVYTPEWGYVDGQWIYRGMERYRTFGVGQARRTVTTVTELVLKNGMWFVEAQTIEENTVIDYKTETIPRPRRTPTPVETDPNATAMVFVPASFDPNEIITEIQRIIDTSDPNDRFQMTWLRDKLIKDGFLEQP